MVRMKCLNLWALPPSVLALPEAERLKLIKEQYTVVSDEGGFAQASQNSQAPLSTADSVLALTFLSVVMGGPVVLMASGIACIIFGSWAHCVYWLTTALALATHPLPDVAAPLARSRLSLALYRYFSYRWLWSGDDGEHGEAVAPFVGCGPPHGVLPLANVLSIPAINACTSASFVGVAASVVFFTPFLRYLTLFGCVSASAGDITKALSSGACAGIVPDGIAGIFRLAQHPTEEVVYLRARKGLAKLALRTGRPIMPVYSMGNTRAFSAAFDPFGLMERLSRAAQAAIFVYWGRCYLPVPYRTPITMCFGRPIEVTRTPHPSDAEVDALHERLQREIVETFERHKAVVGWGNIKLRLE